MSGHPNVIKLYEVFQDSENYYMVFEYLPNGDIASQLNTSFFSEEENLKRIFLNILKGLKFIHERSVIHRDIKIDNILLDSDMNPKIADFGISSIFNPMRPIKDTGGTPMYLAPEVIRAKGEVCLNTDVWSTGIMFFVVVFRQIPFESETVQNLYTNILHQDFELSDDYIESYGLSKEFGNLISSMLVKNPKIRFSVENCLKHPWFWSIKQEEETKLNKKIRRHNFDYLLNISNCSNRSPSSQVSLSLSCKNKSYVCSSKHLEEDNSWGFQGNKSARFLNQSSKNKKFSRAEFFQIENGIDGVFNSTLEKNGEERMKMENISEEEYDSIKLKLIIEYFESVGFPKKYIEMIIFDKDNKFTHLFSCIEILFENLKA